MLCDIDVLLRNPYATRIFKMTISESARIGTAVPTSNNSVPTTTGTTTTHLPDGPKGWIDDVLYIYLSLNLTDLFYFY